ncbi:MAG: nuclear transport factor 2 family protein [Pseudonocardiaceae bacterium]
MDTKEAVDRYYEAWTSHAGDMSGVPLADDFVFVGPVSFFDSAAGFRAMADQFGPLAQDFRVRRQFFDGDLVCSIVEWEMPPIPGTTTAADLLEVRDGVLVRSEVIFDAEELRKAIASGLVNGQR